MASICPRWLIGDGRMRTPRVEDSAATAYLACDAGSSSFKAALYEIEQPVPHEPLEPRWQGETAWTRLPGSAAIRSQWRGQRIVESTLNLEERLSAPERLLSALGTSADRQFRIAVCAHRLVHAGQLETSPLRVTAAIKRTIAAAEALAPEHNALTLAGIDAAERARPQAIQYVVSDSAYHADMPLAASTYGVPAAWQKIWGIRRLGFHGISHGYSAARCAHLAHAPLRALKVVTCHLGNGCSLAATSAGASIDTTMGWTPMEGLVMGQRSGTVDPGIVLYLIERGRYDAAELRRVLNDESGLKGISGLSGDMRELLDAVAEGHPNATLAFDVFVHRVRAGIGAMAASLGGLDILCFTGGIGEHAHEVRQAVCSGLEFLGIELDDDRDAAAVPDCVVSRESSRATVFVIRARETWEIARQCAIAFADKVLR